MRRIATATLLLAACALVVVGPGAPGLPAQDVPPPDDGNLPNLLGSWVTLVNPDLPPEDFASMALDFTAVRNRSFLGTFGLVFIPTEPVQPVDPCRLTVAASGRVSLISRTEERKINAHGEYFVDPTLGPMLALDFKVHFADGTQDAGFLTLVQGD